ncbi:MAG: hypothetical protein F6K09_24350, partial [Merismopedia sp. SIO2A8]|nr:hypothetical protein [Merismopedia sp. SIO2A8]
GDYIGQGKEWFYQPTDGRFSIRRNFDKGVNFNFSNFGHSGSQRSIWWNAEFAAPFEQQLLPGLYEGATRFPFQSSNNPGFSFTGNGRGCNRSGSRFEVLEIGYDDAGVVSSFDAIFAQYCENVSATATPAIFGRVRYNAGAVTTNDDAASVPEPSMLMGLIALSFFGRNIGKR